MPDCDSVHYYEDKFSGKWYQCQLSKGHGGQHIFGISWNDGDKNTK
jgi:hypothetical protein